MESPSPAAPVAAAIDAAALERERCERDQQGQMQEQQEPEQAQWLKPCPSQVEEVEVRTASREATVCGRSWLGATRA